MSYGNHSQGGWYQQRSNKIFVGNAYSGQYGLSGHINLTDIEAHPEHIHTGNDGKRYVKVYINRNKMPVPGKADHNIAINTKPPQPQQQTQGGYQQPQAGYQQAPAPQYQQAPPAQQGGYQMPPQAAGAPQGTPPPGNQPPPPSTYDESLNQHNQAPVAPQPPPF